MDIIIVILLVFFAVSGMIVARVIINRRKRRREAKKEEEEKKPGEQKKGDQKEEPNGAEEEPCSKEEETKEHEGEQRKSDEEKIEPEESKETEEEEQLEAEEKESRAEEKSKANKAEEEKAGKEEAKEKGEKKGKLPPGERGGRPRGSKKEDVTASPVEQKARPLKPEIICWNKGWQWIVAIEVPEEFTSPQVTQNDESIDPDESDETHYPLKHLKGTAKVAWTEGERDIPLMEEERDYLIFKMRKEWKGLGRVVRHTTTGYYLAIVPQEWKRNEDLSGSAPIAIENVQIQGYKAHFFVLKQNKDTAVAFIDARGERIQVELGSSRFQLVGKEIFDSSEDMGPLFGEEPPLIKTLDKQGWDNVRVIVIGEEGSGRNRWRTQFFPQKGTIEQRMPDDLTNRQGGWYFIRIYDNDDDLLESMDFRFSAGLKDIQIMNPECLPKPNGYEKVIVQFTHQANYKVKPADKNLHRTLSIRREADTTIITIPPNSNCDKSHWILENRNAKVKVTVLVERVRWCVGSLNLLPSNWTDKPLLLSRKEFTAVTDKALWLKLPRKRWINKIEVGFNRTKSRCYNVEVEKEEIAIPLRDFCDAEEIGNKQEESAMKIWVSSDEAIVLKIPTKLLPPLKPPRVKPPPLLKPEAEVKSPCGKRKGKGFSRNEINNAGLTRGDVKRLHIPYDKRRKSLHSWNIEKLKSLTER